MSVEKRLEVTEAELVEAREQQAATSEILRLISQSHASAEPVFRSIAAAAVKLCHAVTANIFTYDGAAIHLAATTRKHDEYERRLRLHFPRPPDRGTAAGRSILVGGVVEVPDVTRDPEYLVQQAALSGGFLAAVAVPLLLEGRPIGTLALGFGEPGALPKRLLALLQTFADQAVIAIENARLFKELETEVEAHRRSKAAIQALVEEKGGVDAMVGSSHALAHVRSQVQKVATTDTTVLIQGETGTGKEIVARALHAASKRRERALITVNCAALPRDLVESELFGHEKGAFTGAAQQRRGRFELADGGTLFLDEIGELPLEAQAKLLRVLQQGEFERVGGNRVLQTDVRVIAATNRDLPAEVKAGRFRADLFYRLNVFPIALPPLRERREDIGALVQHFTAHLSRKLGRSVGGVSPAFVEKARAYDWPGNIRELENVIERALIVGDGGPLDASDLLPASIPAREAAAPWSAAAGTIEEVERNHILQALRQTSWKIEGASGAAATLGLNPSTLRGRMRKLGIRKTTVK